MTSSSHSIFPIQNSDNTTRHVGFELEFTALSVSAVSQIVKDVFGGSIEAVTTALHHVKDSKWGDFTIELDATMVKQLAALLEKESNNAEKDAFITPSDYAHLSQNMASIAGKLVPVEIITPPLPIDAMPALDTLGETLKKADAKGTQDNFSYAFGLHINAELPSLSADTIKDYICAYAILYEWLVKAHNVDFSRRLSTYIAPYKEAYIKTILAEDYTPNQEQLIQDYLTHHPSRNYALDMLPLFAHLDPDQIKKRLKDERINARPTFHYRLPNCNIGQKGWKVSDEWERWLMIEKLANNKALLKKHQKHYLDFLNTPLHSFSEKWIDKLNKLVDEL